MAAVDAEPRRGWFGPVARGRRDERRAAVPAPRDGGASERAGDRPEREGRALPDRGAPRVAEPAAHDTGQAFHERWEAALADLELEVEAAEDLLARLHHDAETPPAAPRRPWAPPTGLGPLPAPLADRARALAERQTRTAEALGRAIVLNRRQARAVDALTDARQDRRDAQALYLDVAL
ncbi:hypothetical protein [uncultured Pseudokineococcus sp.]|uniref:hypothetical protein n=1 Tax=uncultured Pseudokineococcus sp. TaxID=1642928 RepID=UPI0026047E50|nr:hypothetical protein [uncultured Pseudokineococcus sp.]